MSFIKTSHESIERLAIAGEVWKSSEGVEYTVLSNTVSNIEYTFVTNRIQSRGNVVKAYTTDLSVDNSNGKWNGVKVHWVTMKNDDFVTNFSQV